jgi:hypothetical protein
MRNSTTQVERRKTWIQEVSSLLPLFTIWGLVWMVNAALDIGEEWIHLPWIKSIVALLAIGCTLIHLWHANRTASSTKHTSAAQSHPPVGTQVRRIWPLLLPGLLLLASILLLGWIGIVGPFFTSLLKGILLAAAYVVLGIWMGRPLIYLGVWLLALAVITGIWYLGYAYVVIEGMGGLSLVLCGLILRTWGTPLSR